MIAMKQIVLKAKGCSGRGVRMRILDPVQRSDVRVETAKQLGPESTNAEWIARESVAGIVATVLEVTKAGGYAKAADLLVPGVEWEKVGAERLQEHLAEYFNAKDLDALAKSFRAFHDISDKELEDILGEALDVTTD